MLSLMRPRVSPCVVGAATDVELLLKLFCTRGVLLQLLLLLLLLLLLVVLLPPMVHLALRACSIARSMWWFLARWRLSTPRLLRRRRGRPERWARLEPAGGVKAHLPALRRPVLLLLLPQLLLPVELHELQRRIAEGRKGDVVEILALCVVQHEPIAEMQLDGGHLASLSHVRRQDNRSTALKLGA
jgi:hypothetical protein